MAETLLTVEHLIKKYGNQVILDDVSLDVKKGEVIGSDLTEEEQKELKKIDHAMLWYDLEHLLGEIQYGEIPELHIDLDYTVRPFEEVEEEYLSLFEKFSSI